MGKRKRKRVLSTKEQFIIGLGLVFFVLFLSTILVIFFSMKPNIDTQNMVKAVATKEAQLTSVSRIDRYNGQTSYYSVFGKTAQDENVVVVIGIKDKDIHIIPTKEGISRQAAEQLAKENGAKSVKATLGYMDDKPIWEVASGTTYYIIDFKTGDLVKTEGI